MRTKVAKKQSGFSEGRSASSGGSARFGDKPKKKKSVEQGYSGKAEKRISKIQNIVKKKAAAQEDLADVVRELDIDVEGNTYDSDKEGKRTSRFAKSFSRLRKNVVENEDFNADAAHKILLKTVFAMTMDLIPVADAAFKQSQKEQAAYALIALTKQAQETSAELRAIGNVEIQTTFIRDNIIAPTFKVLTQHLMNQCMNMKNTVDTELGGKAAKPVKQEIDKLLIGLGQFMDMSREGMSSHVGRYLAGDMSFMQTSSEKKPEKKRRKREA